MRRGFVAAVVLGILLVVEPSAGVASEPPTGAVPSMTITASTYAAKAQAVRFTVRLRYEMQCNYAGAGPVVVTFPSSLKVPERFAAGAVELSGKPIDATIAGRRVTVTIPRHEGILCDVMGPGSLTLTFTHAAKLGNPSRAGSYSFTATHGHRTFVAELKVRPAP